ncbi:polyphosphate polymerase domain-containing protein [Enteractinococcus coprophilus]|uniref:VTC domain-containing protein n=1 Tax=Enteractinococcus coprophilus TaxID=1027633 RepID=A0A543AN02_9MICC|nr:polyphosphate polymerase domain-containing protein [Enteractinococcus coprophilus]TQL73939.1 VTC domain-containing protein [Enteractinococcus coprophilus]
MQETNQKQRFSQARIAMECAVDDRSGISLADVVENAALQTRVDKKFLLTPEQFRQFTNRLGPEFSVMQINGLRTFQYRSTYFDTPDFEQYVAHRQGRRRRYKVRSRTYVESELCMFEIKTKGLRGATVKHRREQPIADAHVLTPENLEFAAQVLAQEYGHKMPKLVPALRNAYRRATLVDPVDGERVTCDVDLRFADTDGVVHGPDMVIVETKTADGRGISDTALAELNIRPVSMSKYCLGVATLNPQLPANNWSRLLKRLDWQRTAAGG